MLGALSTLLSTYWDPLQKALRSTPYSSRSAAMINLDHELRHLGSEVGDGASVGLGHYVALLRAFPRDNRIVEKEEKHYLLAASFMLHDLEEVLAKVTESFPELGEANLRAVTGARKYVTGIIENFRLRPLRRRK